MSLPPYVEAIIDRELSPTGLPGWCTPEKGRRLAELARGASLCVELGVFGARSLVAIALGLRAHGSGRVDGIDPYTPDAALEGKNDPANDKWWSELDYESIAREAQTACYRLGLAQYTRIVRMHSRAMVEFYADRSIDLLHVDSNHSQEVSLWEVEHWASKVRSGGYWIADDVDWPTLAAAQNRLIELGFKVIEHHGTWAVYVAP